ncbi:hypothetical protein ZEAMMB73_Zm00001d043034, partial [Zea mays]
MGRAINKTVMVVELIKDFALHVQEDPTNSDSDAKNSGRTEFPADEDAHSVGDCVKVPIQL